MKAITTNNRYISIAAIALTLCSCSAQDAGTAGRVLEGGLAALEGTTNPNGQPNYGQPNYGQPNYGQDAYGQPNYR
jgi:hypothetical protein